MSARAWLMVLLLAGASGCNVLLDPNPSFIDTEANAVDDSSDSGGSEPSPTQPDWLMVETFGDPNDALVDPLGPGLLLAGGGPLEPTYAWLSAHAVGGDVLVLQTQAPLLAEQLYQGLDGVDSVQALIVPAPPYADAAWIVSTIVGAEVILIAGADADALVWKDTAIHDALLDAWQRGAVIGGLDAGAALLGEFVHPAGVGQLESDAALADPFVPSLTIDRHYLELEPLAGVIVDPRFGEHDRMGRLLALAARIMDEGWTSSVLGVGIDTDAALLIGPDNVGEIVGKGNVYLLRVDQPAEVCEAGQPLQLGPLDLVRLAASDLSDWPGGGSDLLSTELSASNGSTMPADPY